MRGIALGLCCLLLQSSSERFLSSALAEDHVAVRGNHCTEGTSCNPLKQLALLALAAKPAAAFSPSAVRINFPSKAARPVVMQGTAESPTKAKSPTKKRSPTKAQSKAKQMPKLDIRNLKKGQIVEGKVKEVDSDVARVDIGIGKFAVLYSFEFSDKEAIPDLKSQLVVGARVRAKVKKVDVASKMVRLTCRSSPTTVLEKLHIGQPFEGLVVRISPFGAFVDIGAEEKGLIHVSEMFTEKVANPEAAIRKMFNEGDMVTGSIKAVDPQKSQLALTTRDYNVEGRLSAAELVPGQAVEGKVMSIRGFGVFVDVGADDQVLMHVTDVLGTSRIVANVQAELEKIYTVGDILRGRIISTVRQNGGKGARMSCRTPLNELIVGEEVAGTVNGVNGMGVFVDIGSEVNALLHVSDILESWDRGEQEKVLMQMFSEGDRIEARIKEVSTPRRRIALKQDKD